MQKEIRSYAVGAVVLAMIVASVAVAQPNMRPRGNTNMSQTPATTQQREAQDDRRDAVTQDMTGWTKLGERWADGRLDRDEIVVGAVEGTFRRVMLKVEHSRLDLLDVHLFFGDGSMFSPGTRLSFAPGSTSRIIDLPGAARVIRRAEFRYANLPGGGRAQIELWAR